ncbi:MAG: PspA/IM30 family protein [Gammaproteobacteria bacterium]|nr:PspA/IM30 family protein [Gammaproteobacteria bacterium]
MSVFTKLATLLRAGVRESAEAVTDANAIRIYRQEIIDAESMLTQRRDALAAMIAARKELEDDIQASQRRIAKREQQLAKLPAEERSEDLLQLAARDIATTESHLEDSKRGHINLCEKIQREEITLRKLLAEIKEHRRGIKLLESEILRQRGTSRPSGGQTVSGRLAALRQTRSAISEAIGNSDYGEAGMEEALDRVETSPLDRHLNAHGCNDEAQRVAEVLARLKSGAATA